MDTKNQKNQKIALVIFNPGAGLKDKRDIESMVGEKLKTLGYQVDLFYLNSEFEASIDRYKFSNIKLVVAVGGDGTVKVAARTIITYKLKAVLAIVPFGSANVIAVTLGIPLKVEPALDYLGKIDNVVAVDVGLINKKHYFLVGLSVGYFSKVVMGTTERLKNKFGFLGYLISLLSNKVRIRKIKFEIKTQNKIFWVKGNSLVICNAINYFGLKPKKEVDLRDGILNLFVFTNKTFADMIRAFFYILWYQEPPKFIFSLDNSYFKIVLNHHSKDCQIDGDSINLEKNIEIEILPQAVSIVIPKK